MFALVIWFVSLGFGGALCGFDFQGFDVTLLFILFVFDTITLWLRCVRYLVIWLWWGSNWFEGVLTFVFGFMISRF